MPGAPGRIAAGRLLSRRLGWYIDRLRVMSAPELLHRFGEARKRQVWRRRPVGWPEFNSPGPLPAFPLLRQRLGQAAARPHAGLIDSLSRARSGSFRFLGRDWPRYRADSDDAFWLLDPVFGGRWPGRETSSFAVDVRSTWAGDASAPSGARGDVKFVWECNRLQMLHPLAVALAGGDGRAAQEAMSILRDWCGCNPPYAGVNWVSGIELTMRLVSVALLCAASGSDGFAPADRAFLRGVVETHARHLAAFPSLHSSANNHRMAEGLGLLIAGLLTGDAGCAWEREGRAILAVEAERQILSDGVGAEQSPTYQAFTMEMLCLGALLASDAGRPLAPAVSERLADGATFLLALMNENGRVPSIGDDDEGRVLAQPPDREPLYVASVVAAVAGLLGRADFLPPARVPHWRDDLFAVQALGTSLPRPDDRPTGPATFPMGGYTAARDDIAGRRAHIVFDHGPLGYLGLAAHGHADALGLWLDIDGIAVLVDPGTYLYHSGRETRSALRESLAHSTLSIAGRSQSVARPAFSWANRADCTLIDARPGPDWSVTARHDGYRKRFGALHERCVARDKVGFSVRDRLIGPSLWPVEIRYVLDPALAARADERSVAVLKGDLPLCRFVAPERFEVHLRSRRLLSRRFGEIEAGREIVFTGRLGETGATTTIVIAATQPASDGDTMA
jgi:hypothetical protein